VPTHLPLGQSLGISDEQLVHLLDDPLPEGVYDATQRAIVRFARQSTRMEPIDDELFTELRQHFDTRSLIELCFTVGISNSVNRFHALFRTPLDEHTRALVEGSCPLDLPPAPEG
jgi:alkylhydroperoxidase family enzyme